MMRPGFLSNKRVTCDFCGNQFFGNLNTSNLILCWRCVHNLCTWTNKEKLAFLEKFKGNKDKEKLIKRFISEEVITSGGETEGYKQNTSRGCNNQGFGASRTKIWKVKGSVFLGKRRA